MRDVGWLAAGAAALATLLEAADAADGFAPAGLRDFLLANVAGVARVSSVLLVAAAVVACAWRPRLAAGFVALALGALAASGHAASSQPRLPSVLNDWLHLGAGAVWLGGLAVILAVWAPTLRRGGRRARMALARHVLPRFGRVALAAFLVAAASGLAGLVQQLGHVSALWQTAYGRVLAVKIGLVALIAAASYVHAMRLRPRLLAARSRVANDLERRHWRLVRSEPALAGGVVAAVAVLVTFPLPPRQLGDADDEARAAAPICDPCPLPAPARGELAVAEGAGSHLVAGWIRRGRRGLAGTVRVLDSEGKPARAPFEVHGARQRACGPGCRRFETGGAAAVLRVTVTERGRRFVAELPARWRRGQDARARRLLERAQATMRRLRSVHEIEEVTSGPGSYARTDYRVRAPDRMTYTTNRGIESVIVGRRQWFRSPSLPWEARDYGAGLAFRTRTWFRWTTYARAVRLLGLRRERGRPVAVLALADLATPVWFRLVVDRGTRRILRARMIAEAHFMTQRYRAFNRPLTIRPPPMRAEAKPGLLRPAGRALAVLAVALFVALLAYGLLSKPADTTIDDALARGKLSQAPGLEHDLLPRGDPGPELRAAVDRAAADGRVDLDELRGRPVVLNVWASWCGPCRDEARALERTWRSVRRRGVLFLGLDVRDLRDEARAFLREFRITYPSVRDGSGDSMRTWGVTGVPETFFLTADGRIAGHVIGTISESQLAQGIAAARARRPVGARGGGAQLPVEQR